MYEHKKSSYHFSFYKSYQLCRNTCLRLHTASGAIVRMGAFSVEPVGWMKPVYLGFTKHTEGHHCQQEAGIIEIRDSKLTLYSGLMYLVSVIFFKDENQDSSDSKGLRLLILSQKSSLVLTCFAHSSHI